MKKLVILELESCSECPFLFDGYDKVCQHKETYGYSINNDNYSSYGTEFSGGFPNFCPLKDVDE